MAAGFVQFRYNFWRRLMRILAHSRRRGRCFAGDPPAEEGDLGIPPPILGAIGGQIFSGPIELLGLRVFLVNGESSPVTIVL